MPPNRGLTLAVAGVFQAAALVHQIASRGDCERSALHQSGYSLIRLDVDHIEDLYGSVYGVELGLRTIIKLFAYKPDLSTKDIYQYAIAVHQLSVKLAKLQKTSDIIHQELAEVKTRFPESQDDQSQDDALHESLANLYSRTISYLTPRIIVQGSSEKLQQRASVNRVRTALFAGIRAAYLWNQLGGRRWHLILHRKEYAGMAKSILNA